MVIPEKGGGMAMYSSTQGTSKVGITFFQTDCLAQGAGITTLQTLIYSLSAYTFILYSLLYLVSIPLKIILTEARREKLKKKPSYGIAVLSAISLLVAGQMISWIAIGGALTHLKF